MSRKCRSDSCHAREPKRSRGRSEGAKSDGTRGRDEVFLGRGGAGGGRVGAGGGEGGQEQNHEKGGEQERRRRQMRRAQSEATAIDRKVKFNQNLEYIGGVA